MNKEETLLELGKFYFINQKFEEAIKEFKEVIELNSGNVDAFYNLGLAYEVLNDYTNAKAAYDRVLELNPEHELAKAHAKKVIGSD